MSNSSKIFETSLNALAEKVCIPQKPDSPKLNLSEIEQLITCMPNWTFNSQPFISREYKLSNYQQTVDLVNTIAKIADLNDHHPEVSFTYNTCKIRYSTHANNGITENDFICAAQIEQAFRKVIQ